MIGKILGGRYEILEEVGKGGMAVVYKAKCKLLNRIVAVKVLRSDLDGSDEFIKRFNVEAQSAASLTHPNIVSIYDVGTDGDIHYIVMEYVEGETLKNYIKENGRLSWKKALSVTMKICGALEEAHKKHIVHRDIKPHNIIVMPDETVKVTDFGIARASGNATLSVDDDVLGSVHYFSPEQARGGFVDEKSDIYSLGVVLYEMLTGKVPFVGESPIAVAMKHLQEEPQNVCDIYSDIPFGVQEIVSKAMKKETRTRYQTVGEMKCDLETALENPENVIIDEDTLIDDSPTQKIAPINKEVVINIPVSSANPKKSPKKKSKLSKSDKKIIILSIFTSLLIVAAVSLTVANFIYPELNLFSFGSKEITVPNLVGMTLSQAEEELEGTRYTIEVEDEIEDSKVDAGKIISQSPKENKKVKVLDKILVVISKGADEIILSDYRSEEYKKVETELKKKGLKVELEFQKDASIVEDFVIKTEPAAGTTVKSGATVILYVSNGIEVETVTVPNLIGKTLDDAKKLIESENLVVGNVSYESSNSKEGNVIRQNIAGGDIVSIKTPINIVVSNGSAASSNQNQTEKLLTISLPQDKEVVALKIMANNQVVYSGSINTKTTPEFSRKFKGSGTVKFDIYVDDKLIGSKSINFNN